MGRPPEYKPEYVAKAEEYLAECQDEDVQTVKQANEEKGYEMFENKLKVKLPTLEGFARYIGVNKTSLYEWEKLHPDFSNALDKIRTEQHDRLVNNGLSGDYNPTIAKLILSANHGMREKQEIDHNNPDGNLKSITIIKNGTGSNNQPAAEADGSMGSI